MQTDVYGRTIKWLILFFMSSRFSSTYQVKNKSDTLKLN